MLATTIERATAAPLNSDAILDTREAADLLGLSTSHLKHLRVRGDGPPYSRLGGAIRYRVGDLLDWVASKKVSSTSSAR
jgi:predicted DNA-binding transcriptional regulator AlpA